MPIKLTLEKIEQGIPAMEMKSGQIGRIVACAAPRYIGWLVQRVHTSLFCHLGSDTYWPSALPDTCRVEILPNGTYTMELTGNE